MFYKEKPFEDLAQFKGITIERAMEATKEDYNDPNKLRNLSLENYYKEANPLGYLNKENMIFHIVKDTNVLLFCFANNIKTTLELGCGASITSLLLAKNGVNCIAYDFPSEVLRFQTWRKKKYRLTNLKYLGLTAFNKDRNQYDAVICFEVLEHIKDPRETIDKLDNKLKPGGLFFMTISSQAGINMDYLSKLDPEHICEMTNGEVVGYIIDKGYDAVQGLRMSETRIYQHGNFPIVFKKRKQNEA